MDPGKGGSRGQGEKYRKMTSASSRIGQRVIKGGILSFTEQENKIGSTGKKGPCEGSPWPQKGRTQRGNKQEKEKTKRRGGYTHGSLHQKRTSTPLQHAQAQKKPKNERGKQKIGLTKKGDCADAEGGSVLAAKKWPQFRGKAFSVDPWGKKPSCGRQGDEKGGKKSVRSEGKDMASRFWVLKPV